VNNATDGSAMILERKKCEAAGETKINNSY